jgi:hypothetical protein
MLMFEGIRERRSFSRFQCWRLNAAYGRMPGCGFADIPDVTATGGQASLKQAETWRARRFIDRTIKHVLDSSTKA